MGGTIEKLIQKSISRLQFAQDYFNGRMDRDEFRSMVTKNRDVLIDCGLNDYWIHLLKQMPPDNRQDAQRMLDELYRAGCIASPVFDEAVYLSLKKNIDKYFMHLPDRFTSIFSEETRCAYSLSMAINPKNIVFAGSYYNYLAVWLIPGLAADGRMVCLDVDPVVCSLAEKNMKALGLDRYTEIICGDACEYLESNSEPIDLLVVDAYGSYSYPDKKYHGKSIYAPLVYTALPKLTDHGFIMAHNAEEGAVDLNEFYRIVSDFKFSMLVNTTENIGVFQR